MKALARRWLSGDERTLGAFLVVGVLTMAFFRLDTLRAEPGTGTDPLAFLLVVTAVTWWSLLPRSFVWRDPADLTWRDFDDTDRATIVVAAPRGALDGPPARARLPADGPRAGPRRARAAPHRGRPVVGGGTGRGGSGGGRGAALAPRLGKSAGGRPARAVAGHLWPVIGRVPGVATVTDACVLIDMTGW